MMPILGERGCVSAPRTSTRSSASSGRSRDPARRKKKPRPRQTARPGPNRIPPTREGLNGTSLAGRGVYVQPTDRSAALDGDLPRLGSLHLRKVQSQHTVLQLRPDAARVYMLADAERPEVVAGAV